MIKPLITFLFPALFITIAAAGLELAQSTEIDSLIRLVPDFAVTVLFAWLFLRLDEKHQKQMDKLLSQKHGECMMMVALMYGGEDGEFEERLQRIEKAVKMRENTRDALFKRLEL